MKNHSCLFDTHAHLYLKDFHPDWEDVLNRTKKACCGVILPNIDENTIDPMLALCDQEPSLFFPAIGLHPCSIDQSYRDKLRKIEKQLPKRKWIAIGEIGLDFYWSQSYVREQMDALHIQLQWAHELQKPVILHTREAMQEMITIIGRQVETGKTLSGVFHCFTGNEKEAFKVIELGFYLGIGGIVTFKKNPLKSYLNNIPIDRIVLETDSPYLAPVPYRGKRNEPSFIHKTAESVALLYDVPIEILAEKINHNAKALFLINS